MEAETEAEEGAQETVELLAKMLLSLEEKILLVLWWVRGPAI